MWFIAFCIHTMGAGISSQSYQIGGMQGSKWYNK
jgi:hypothetical protein